MAEIQTEVLCNVYYAIWLIKVNCAASCETKVLNDEASLENNKNCCCKHWEKIMKKSSGVSYELTYIHVHICGYINVVEFDKEYIMYTVFL